MSFPGEGGEDIEKHKAPQTRSTHSIHRLLDVTSSYKIPGKWNSSAITENIISNEILLANLDMPNSMFSSLASKSPT